MFNNVCPKCGNQIGENFIFCSKCGERVDGKFLCDNCNTLLDKDSNFCYNCGKRFDGKKVCNYCDAIVNENSRFCPVCGKPIIDNIRNKAAAIGFIGDNVKLSTNKKVSEVKLLPNKRVSKVKQYLFGIIKCSITVVCAFLMFVMSFLSLFNIQKSTFEDIGAPTDIELKVQFSSIDYITFMFDSFIYYKNPEKSPLYDKLEKDTKDLAAAIKDEDNINEKEVVDLFEKVTKGTTRLNLQTTKITDNYSLIDIILNGVCSLVYILATLNMLVLSILKLIYYILNKNIKIKGYNFFMVLPLMFMFALVIFAPIGLTTSGAFVWSFIFAMLALAANAVFILIERGIVSVKKIVFNSIALGLSLLLLICSTGSLMSYTFKCKASDRQIVKNYSYNLNVGALLDNVYSKDMIDEFWKEMDLANVKNIEEYFALRKQFYNKTTNSILNNDLILAASIPVGEIFIADHFSNKKFFFLFEYIAEVLFLITAIVTFSLIYLNFIREKNNVKISSKILQIINASFSIIALLTIGILIVKINNTIPNKIQESLRLTALPILQIIFSVAILVMLFIPFCKKEKKDSFEDCYNQIKNTVAENDVKSFSLDTEINKEAINNVKTVVDTEIKEFIKDDIVENIINTDDKTLEDTK